MPMMDIAERLLELARRAGADAASARVGRSNHYSATMRMGNLDEIERSEQLEVGLRALVGRRQAVASVSATDADSLSALAERAVAMAKESPEDPWCALTPSDEPRDDGPLELYHPEHPTAAQLREAATEIDEAMRAAPGVTNGEGSTAGWYEGHDFIAFSNGYRIVDHDSYWWLTSQAIAGEGPGMRGDYHYVTRRRRSDLPPPAEIGREAGRLAARMANPRKAPGGSVPVILERRIAASLLGHLLSAVNGASVARGSSFLKDKMGERIFPAGVNVIDDPFIPRALGSRMNDGEGLRKARRHIIEDGVLKSWLLDGPSARRLGLESNGCAHGGAGTLSRPGASNAWISAGTITPEAMIKDVKRGLLVTGFIGASVNPNTGAYSRGVEGIWIENGECAYPVDEATLAGNLNDMFLAMIPANDLLHDRSMDAPTIRLDGCHVAGG